jgi:hypothetical protein
MTAIRPLTRQSERSVVEAEVVVAWRGRLLGDSVVAVDMRASIGSVDSTPVKMWGAALGKLNAFTSFRIAGMTQSGMGTASGFFVPRGVLRPVAGVFGVVLVDADAAVALLLGVCGSRVASDAGSALLR